MLLLDAWVWREVEGISLCWLFEFGEVMGVVVVDGSPLSVVFLLVCST